MKLLQRRKNALALLEKQLADGTKPPKEAPHGITLTQFRKDNPKVPLTPKDRERIQKEIDNLKHKINFANQSS